MLTGQVSLLLSNSQMEVASDAMEQVSIGRLK